LSPIDTLFTNAKLADGSITDIAVANGRIAAVSPAGTQIPSGAPTCDLGGALVVPGFVEGHIHLDTSFYGDAWKPHKPYTNGFNVHERVAFQAQNFAEAAPVEVRARNQLDLCIGHGSTHMRSHVTVDGAVGLRTLEKILAVREAYKDIIDIQLVAFPQSGILQSPVTAE
jgi:cytosine/creatinine deaminase